MLFFYFVTVALFLWACKPSEVPEAKISTFDVELLFYLCDNVDNLGPLSMTCKYFWNVITLKALNQIYRIHSFPHNFDPFTLYDSRILVGSSLSSVLSAFSVPKRAVEINYVAINLSTFLQSPAFRKVFLQSYWSLLKGNEVLNEQREQLGMFQNDLPRTRLRNFDKSLIKNVETRLYILASLPLIAEEISTFLNQTDFPLLIPATEESFDYLFERISTRLILLPVLDLLHRYLPLFAFDNRLVAILVRKFVQKRRFTELNSLLEFNLPPFFQVFGHIYFGCVKLDDLVAVIENDLNSLDSAVAVSIIRRVANVLPRFRIYLKPEEFKSSTFRARFHALLLRMDWNSLRELFTFGPVFYDDSLEFLSSMPPSAVLYAIKECPQMARLHALLLDSRYQNIHFGSFTTLQSLRYAMKEVIEYPDVLSAYINYCESKHPQLYSQLIDNSAGRINDYFAMNLDSAERKRYKNHPSFVVAIGSLDGILERRLEKAQKEFEYFDKEATFKTFVNEMDINPADLKDYFELAHTFPSFSQAMTPSPPLDPQSQLIRLSDLSAAVGVFNIHRVIDEGGRIRYDLIIRLMKQFKGSLTAGVIPVELLRHFVKSAAFFMTRTRDSRHFPFKASSALNLQRIALILTIQGAGQKAAVRKLFKNRFPEEELHPDLLDSAIFFYSAHLSDSQYIPTNTENETFVIELSKCVLQTGPLGTLQTSIISVLTFTGIPRDSDLLLMPQLLILISIAHFELQ